MNYDVYSQRRYIPELDGLRGLSVLLVITHHLRDQTYWSWLMGQLGVTIFFVISGYLITTLCLREEQRYGAISLKAFFVRRCLRILPLYYLTLAIYCLLVFLGGVTTEKRDYFLAALPYYLTYLQELPTFFGGILIDQGDQSAPLSHSWSLGIEEKFYIFWPLLAFVILRGAARKRQLVTLMLTMALGVAPLIQGQAWAEQYSVTAAMLVGSLIPYSKILWGCLLGSLLEDRMWFDRLRLLAQPWCLGLATAVLVGLHLTLPQIKSVPLVFAWVEAVYVGVVGLFLVAVLLGKRRYRRILAWGPLVFVGKISYGIYLFHVIALNAVQRGIQMFFPGMVGSLGGSILELLIGGALSVSIAYIMHIKIEQPLIVVGREWSQRIMRRRDVGEPAAIVVTSG